MTHSIQYALAVQPDDSDLGYLQSLWADRSAAADYADDSADPEPVDAPWHSGLDLVGVIEQEVRCYESMNGSAYSLIAARLRELADEVRFSGARTVADFHARAELMIDWRSNQEAGR